MWKMLLKKQHLIVFIGGLIIGFVVPTFIQYTQYVHMLERKLLAMSNRLKSEAIVVKYEDDLHDGVRLYDDAYNNYAVAQFNDDLQHRDDDTIAQELSRTINVVCLVLTSAKTLSSHSMHIKSTWAQRCNTVVFLSNQYDATFPTDVISEDPNWLYSNTKELQAFKYAYEHYYDEADWFLVVDDSTYIILENLRYMISVHSPTDPIYFGHRMNFHSNYFSGGYTYILSKNSLEIIAKSDNYFCSGGVSAVDSQLETCIQDLDIQIVETDDMLGRNRFTALNVPAVLHNDLTQMVESSDYPVSFHYVTPRQMYKLEYFTYHASVYGLVRGLLNLNKDPYSYDGMD